MKRELMRLLDAGVLEPIDVAFAEMVSQLVSGEDENVMLAAAFASNAVQRGHVCLDMAQLNAAGLRDREGEPVEVVLPATEAWQDELRRSALVGEEPTAAPLFMDDTGRLYLSRYADYQARLARQLLERSQRCLPYDETACTRLLRQLFPAAPGEPDRQKLAAFVALRQALCVISGGPGTGKTTTVAKLLALLQTQALAAGKALSVLLLAPTGKAAQRLGEALASGVAKLPCSAAVKEQLPARAFTIHHALGYQPRTPTRFRHHLDRPLAADVVLVDEASMVDLALMTKLVEAVDPRARLILLGDRDQLASVEAGAVFGDICEAAGNGMSAAFARAAETVTGDSWAQQEPVMPLSDCVVQLTRSYRYSDSSSIGALARALNRGAADEAVAVLRGEQGMPYGEVALAPLPAGELLSDTLGILVRDGFRGYLHERAPERQLEQLNTFRVLCAHRRGPTGVERVNRDIEQLLESCGWLSRGRLFYDKRPIIITENDYQLDLFNGDIGVVRDGQDHVSRAFFATVQSTAAQALSTQSSAAAAQPTPAQSKAAQSAVAQAASIRGPRGIPTARLPAHETVFAMTVHKSQGSEMSRIALLLPPKPSPILTRELLYTAISRARRRVDIFGPEPILRAAITRRIARRSGLVDTLRTPP